MQITFIETRRMSLDGHAVTRFTKGETVDLGREDAVYAIRKGWAIKTDSTPITEHTLIQQIIENLKGHGITARRLI